MKLRPYQQTAIEKIFHAWETQPSAMIVCATGTGKTVTFSEVIKRMKERNRDKRALVIAHRQELIWQAADTIKRMGLVPAVEMGEHKAELGGWLINNPDVIVSTVQTQSTGRMTRFNPADFSVVIIDEAHHYGHKGIYEKTLSWYKQNRDIKILGVTATPDRLDQQNVMKKLGGVVFKFDTLDAINDGWLVPLKQKLVQTTSIDFSHVRTTAGDLNAGDLAEILEAERPLQEITIPLLDIPDEMRTIVFAASVKHAKMMAEILNRTKPDRAFCVSAKTPKDERKELLGKFKEGGYQYAVNVGILTEGFDDAGVKCVAVGRPTKSRALYTQMAGRCIRPAGEIAEELSSIECAEKRKALIQRSSKPECLIIDFCGNAGRHNLICTADLLCTDVDAPAVKRAKNNAMKSGQSVNMLDEIQKAEEEIQAEIETHKRKLLAEAAKKKELIAKATYSSTSIDPFKTYNIARPPQPINRRQVRPPTPRMIEVLEKQGVKTEGLSFQDAQAIMNELFDRWNNGKWTFKQQMWLGKHGITMPMSKEAASNLMNKIIQEQNAARWR